MPQKFNTPIAFFIFKRPEETDRVFQMIKKMRPSTLLIVADGPRNEDEKKLTEEARAVVSNIDWECKVLRNYSEENQGCKKRVSSGLDWVFQNVDKAIILEDDCLPNESFFTFCEEMLTEYENNEKIMHIGGLNMQKNQVAGASYYFSQIAQIWGWATWKRAWEKYDVSMSDWPKVREEKKLNTILKKPVIADYFEYLFERMYRGELTTWDVAWTYSCMKENGLAIVPNKNLIENIGLGAGATHSQGKKGDFGNTKTEELYFPLIYLTKIEISETADNLIYKKVFGINARIGQKVLWFIKSRLPNTYASLKSFSHFFRRR